MRRKKWSKGKQDVSILDGIGKVGADDEPVENGNKTLQSRNLIYIFSREFSFALSHNMTPGRSYPCSIYESPASQSCGSGWDTGQLALYNAGTRPAWVLALVLLCFVCFNGQVRRESSAFPLFIFHAREFSAYFLQKIKQGGRRRNNNNSIARHFSQGHT